MKVNITVKHMGKTVDTTVFIMDDEYDIIHCGDGVIDHLLQVYHEIEEGNYDVSTD